MEKAQPMKAQFSMDFDGAMQAAEFFAALAEAMRTVATNVKKAWPERFSETADAKDPAPVFPVAASEGRAAVAPPTTTAAAADTSVPVVEKKTRKPRAPKAEASAPADVGAPAEEAAPVSDDDLRTAGQNVGKAHQAAGILEILQAFGIRRYPECTAERRPRLLAALKLAADTPKEDFAAFIAELKSLCTEESNAA